MYSFCEGEIPGAIYINANNITNAKLDWEKYKDPEDVLLAIFEGDREIWRSKVETGYQFDAVR